MLLLCSFFLLFSCVLFSSLLLSLFCYLLLSPHIFSSSFSCFSLLLISFHLFSSPLLSLIPFFSPLLSTAFNFYSILLSFYFLFLQSVLLSCLICFEFSSPPYLATDGGYVLLAVPANTKSDIFHKVTCHIKILLSMMISLIALLIFSF